MGPFPDQIASPPVVLRRWALGDAERLSELVDESRDHLAPWMPWATTDPIGGAFRREWIGGVNQRHDARLAAAYAITVADRIVGGCGLDGVSEGHASVGYWVHPDETRKGYATAATSALVAVAQGAGLREVWLRCDVANVASRGVARRVGFTPSHEEAHAIEASGHSGVSVVHIVRLGTPSNPD